MKKIKLLTSLGATLALSGGVALTTSCSCSSGGEDRKTPDGSVTFNDFAALVTYLKTAHFPMPDSWAGAKIDATKINDKDFTELFDLLDNTLNAGMLAEGAAIFLHMSYVDQQSTMPQTTVSWRTTTDNAIIADFDTPSKPSSNATKSYFKLGSYKGTKKTYKFGSYEIGSYNDKGEAVAEATSNFDEVDMATVVTEKYSSQYIPLFGAETLVMSYGEQKANDGYPLYLPWIDYNGKVEVTNIPE